jgi:hypothetical protein
MFCVSEAQAAVIRTAFEQHGELSAVVENCVGYFQALITLLWRGSASASSLAGNCRASNCHSLPAGQNQQSNEEARSALTPCRVCAL